MANFNLDDEQFQSLVTQQILSSISEETKNKLIGEALSFLMKEGPRDSYSRTTRPSPLAEAFQTELLKIARRVAQTVLAEEKIQAEVERAVESFVRTAVEERGFDLSYVIGQAISQNLEVQFTSSN